MVIVSIVRRREVVSFQFTFNSLFSRARHFDNSVQIVGISVSSLGFAVTAALSPARRIT